MDLASPVPPPSPSPRHRNLDMVETVEHETEDQSQADAENIQPTIESIASMPGYTRMPPRARPHRRVIGSWANNIPPRWRLSGVNTTLRRRYQVSEAELAAQLFKAKDYRACLDICIGILANDTTTDAISARIHMMVATPELDQYLQSDRVYHLREAIKAWDKTIQRSGVSRLPIHIAEQEKARAVELLKDAEADEVEFDDDGDVMMR